MRRINYLFIFVLLLGISTNAYSQNTTPKKVTTTPRSYAATLKVSTLGFGLEGVTNVAQDLNVRVGGHFFNYTHNGGGSSTDDYKYDAQAKLLSFSALADYYIGGSIFRVTGGLLVNLNKVDITMIPNKSYTINGQVYNPSDIGQVTATTDFVKAAPYLGLGLFNPLSASKVGFTMDIGGVYQSAPNVTMTATKLLTPTASQEDVVEKNLDWFKFYPVVTFGLTYKFN